ncbi:MAG: metal ABC transporter ATP-binding protein [Candidatus Sumerlaeia bacterium]
MSAPAVQIESVSVRFGDWLALDGIDFALPAGAFMTIVGPNGAGKTTLLRCILGLTEPTSGRARVFEKPPLDCPAGWIGYVPQVKTLDRSFPAKAVELVATGMLGRWPARLSRAEREAAMEALEHVGMAALADRTIAKLSGGELQRVYLARALARRPRLITLDEPAAGLDVAGEADMYDVLEKYQARTGATIVMITHDWDASHHHSSHVLVMVRHQVAFGPPEEALKEDILGQAFGHGGHRHRF